MAKKLMVNKFYVRFNGIRYGKGDIIPNVPDEMARQLIAGSRGSVVEIAAVGGPVDNVDNEQTQNENPHHGNENKNLPNVNEGVWEDETPEPSAELPPVEPSPDESPEIPELPLVDPKATMTNTRKKQ